MLHELKMKFKYGIMTDCYRNVYKVKNRKKAVWVPVLAFHWFLSDEVKSSDEYKDNRWYASVKVFEEQLIWLKDHGYYSLTGQEFYDWFFGKKKLTGKPILLTFDDGELSQLELVMPLLHKYGLHGICFAVGKHYADDRTAVAPAGAQEDSVSFFTKQQFDASPYANTAMEIGYHTYNLHYRLNGNYAIDVISNEEMKADIERMKQFNFKLAAMPYGAYGSTIEIVKSQYDICFAIDRMENPYACRKVSQHEINRICVDGTTEGDYLKHYLY